jgi:hypothetical protein
VQWKVVIISQCGLDSNFTLYSNGRLFESNIAAARLNIYVVESTNFQKTVLLELFIVNKIQRSINYTALFSSSFENFICVWNYLKQRTMHSSTSHSLQVYKVLSESSWTVIVVTASVKEDERGGQGHTSANLLHQSATWHHALNTHCFDPSAFSTSCFPLAVMDGKIEQCVCIKFCVKFSKSATITLEMLCGAFREHSLSRTVVFKWHSCFKARWVSVEDNKHSGRSSTSKTTEDVEQIWELSHEDHCRTVHELADTVGISYGVCREILIENLNMRRIAAKFVPRLLTNDQKQQHVNVCFELREKANEDPAFMDHNGWQKLDLWLWSRNKAMIIAVEEPTITKSKKCAAGLEFNREHAYCFFLTWRGLFSVNLFLLTLRSTITFTATFVTLERKCATKKTRTLVQPQLAPSSWQCACPHVPENHRVCD